MVYENISYQRFNMFQVFEGERSLRLSKFESCGCFCFETKNFRGRDLLSLCCQRFKIFALKLLMGSVITTDLIHPFYFGRVLLCLTFS